MINDGKSIRVDFTLRFPTYIPSVINGKIVPQANSARYLGLHLDSKLNWAEHIRQKRDELNLRFREFSWLIGRRSTLSLDSKRVIHTSMFKPIWTYGIQLWGTAKASNRMVIQRFQNKFLRSIVNAPWYLTNAQLHADLNLRSVDEEYKRFVDNYSKRLHRHSNVEALMLRDPLDSHRRLNKVYPLDSM